MGTPLLESQIKTSILEFLSIHGIFCWNTPSTGIYDPSRGKFRARRGRFQIKGVSDILGILPDGRFLAIEVKRPKGGRVSPDQAFFVEKIRQSGGVAGVCRSIDEVRYLLCESNALKRIN